MVDRSRHIVSQDISWHRSRITPAERERLLGHKPATVWLTGLSGSGKSTIAFELESMLFESGHACLVLDGDNTRHGLSRDLGFSPQDRRENIRRVAEVARLFNDAGLVAITSFISPYREDREMAREIVGRERFVEIWLSTRIETCEARDPKGLYAKARAGKLPDFTGISAPYEAPASPALELDTGMHSAADCVRRVAEYLDRNFR